MKPGQDVEDMDLMFFIKELPAVSRRGRGSMWDG